MLNKFQNKIDRALKDAFFSKSLQISVTKSPKRPSKPPPTSAPTASGERGPRKSFEEKKTRGKMIDAARYEC